MLKKTIGQSFPKFIVQFIHHKEHHSFSLTEDGKLTAVGNNDYGQLGVGHQDPIANPTEVDITLPLGVRIVDIFSSLGITAFLTNHDSLYMCGINNMGQLGIGETNKPYQLKPMKMILPEGERATMVYMILSNKAIWILTKSNKIFACGANGEYKQAQLRADDPFQTWYDISYLGVGHTADKVHTPEYVMQLNPNETILKIQAERIQTSKKIGFVAITYTNQRTLMHHSDFIGIQEHTLRPTEVSLPYNEKVSSLFFSVFSLFNDKAIGVNIFIFTQSNRIMVYGMYFGGYPQYLAQDMPSSVILPDNLFKDLPPLLFQHEGKLRCIKFYPPPEWLLKEMRSPYRRTPDISNFRDSYAGFPLDGGEILHMQRYDKGWRITGSENTYLCHYNEERELTFTPETPQSSSGYYPSGLRARSVVAENTESHADKKLEL